MSLPAHRSAGSARLAVIGLRRGVHQVAHGGLGEDHAGAFVVAEERDQPRPIGGARGVTRWQERRPLKSTKVPGAMTDRRAIPGSPAKSRATHG